MTTGRHYGGQYALVAAIVEETAGADERIANAVAHARALADKTKPARGEIKETLYAEVAAALRKPTAS